MHKESLRYYLFSFSNFIAAFGGGMILGKSVGIIKNAYLQGDSVLAFFFRHSIGSYFFTTCSKKIC